jgi:hypothetical protein
MMMEAIRLSLAAEEERKRKDERDAAKETKKEVRKKAKEIKKVAKAQRNIGSGFHPIDIDGLEDSGASSSAAAGKGKAVDRTGSSNESNLQPDPTSATMENPQKHLEESRAQIQRETSDPGSTLYPFDPMNEQSSHRSALRNLSNASSSASSFAESYQNSLRQDSQNNLAPGSASPNAAGMSLSQGETPPQGTPGTEPMFNFQSLAEAITPEEETKDDGPQHIEHLQEKAVQPVSTNGNAGSAPTTNAAEEELLGESVMTLKPDAPAPSTTRATADADDDDEIAPAPRIDVVSSDQSFDQKQLGDVSMVEGVGQRQATQ